MGDQQAAEYPGNGRAGTRTDEVLLEGWVFRLEAGGEQAWQAVTLPHCWNAADVAEDQRPYHRGVGCYRRTLHIPEQALGQSIHLLFEGANQEAEVLVNGQHAGSHLGGYTAFTCDISGLVTSGDNELVVRLSNAPNPAVAPVGGDIMAFGGLYRPVRLLCTDPLHFDLALASDGVYVDGELHAGGTATVHVQAVVRNARPLPVEARIWHAILDPDGRELQAWSQTIAVPARGTAGCTSTAATLDQPRWWTPETPALYRLRSRLVDGAGRLGDAVETTFGLRSVRWDAQRGLLLNGRPRFLRGVGKHQDLRGCGYAVADAVLREDIRLIRAMGADFTKSHYPLSQGSYEACDSQGVMAWVRLPIMDKVHLTPDFEAATRRTLQEMVAQNRNHPAVILWGTACEPLGDADWFWPRPQDPARLAEVLAGTTAMLGRFKAELTRLDPSRPTADEFHTDPNPQWYVESGLSRIHDFNGWNLYQGWYHASLDALPGFLRRITAWEGGRAYLIAEHGAGSDTRIHSDTPTIFDFSTEYQELFHRRYFSAVRAATDVAGLTIWTFTDFEVQAQRNVMPHVNNKGMLTGDRQPKDVYHLVAAHWSSRPVVHIASSHWLERLAVADPGETMVRPIRIYTNQQRVELLHNGRSLGLHEAVDRVATWEVPFVSGDNRLRALGRDAGVDLEHALTIRFRCLPRDLRRSFPPRLCINLGQSRTYFNDPGSGDIWLPDQPYATGSFGHLDGEICTRWPDCAAWDGIREGIDATILGTDLDPVFQTFRLGLTRYRIDAPAGRYRVALYFTEPFTAAQRRDPAAMSGADGAGRRCFEVVVNAERLHAGLDLAAQHGEHRAVISTCEVSCGDGSGLSIELRPLIGLPVLCGLSVEPLS